ncbi:MAG TPA: DinB family protein [Bryobacteraceae bacterium]|nr:DinB family protein [Bryobacteraceae bacterium]
MNPYAIYLGGQNPMDVIAATSERLDSLARAIGAERAKQPPAPGKWCAREILCHLADAETVFAFRLRQSLAEDHHVIQPFDQEKWAVRYSAYDLAGALAVFSAVRRWNLALIRSAGSGELGKPLTHPERGDMTFQVLIETMAGHDLNHLRQMESIASRSASV